MNDIIKKYISKFKSPKILIIVGICGIVLIMLSSLVTTKDKKTDNNSSSEITADEYKKDLEEDIKDLVISITGSKNVSVVITLDSGIKYSYADINEDSSANKTDSETESTSNQTKQSYITVKTSDGGEKPLMVTSYLPEVRGIAIVCEGGDDTEINEKITNAVTAALNITSKRIYIAGGKEK